MSGAALDDAEFDSRYEAYFNRADIDGWEIRKVNFNFDVYPEGLHFKCS
jgi:hypothetical protein